MRREQKEARQARVAEKKNFTRGGEAVVSQSSHRWARVSARKARLLADLIRNKSVGEARRIVEYAVKPSVQPLVKRLLLSAVANVDRSKFNDQQIEGLCVGEIFADSSLTIKRFRPRAMGRMNQIRKRTCHITLRLTDRFDIKSLEEFASDENEEKNLVAPVETAEEETTEELVAEEAVETEEIEASEAEEAPTEEEASASTDEEPAADEEEEKKA